MEKRSTPSLQITDRFGAQTAFASLRLPDGHRSHHTAEHAAAIYVNEQPAFRVVWHPGAAAALALGRLLTEGWIASADEVEQIAPSVPRAQRCRCICATAVHSPRRRAGGCQLLHR